MTMTVDIHPLLALAISLVTCYVVHQLTTRPRPRS